MGLWIESLLLLPSNNAPELLATSRRAQFVSNSELQRRREEGTCLSCGSEGHLVRACDLLPPLRPRPTVTAAQMGDNI